MPTVRSEISSFCLDSVDSPWLTFPEDWILPACLHNLLGVQGEIQVGRLARWYDHFPMAHFEGKTRKKAWVTHPYLPEMILQ